MTINAVLFDLGGVVLGSPLHAIARFEVEKGIPTGFVNRHVMESTPDGAWHRLERGELSAGPEFFAAFDQECRSEGQELSSEEMMSAISSESLPRPQMLHAIEVLRREGLLVAALTNNWSASDEDSRIEGRAGGRDELRKHFHHFIESSVVGLRKPDPRIYRLACDTLGVCFEEVVFLDDIGANLKPARALGMTTIKVVDPDAALAELAELVGFSLDG